ncbi:MAG: hypothetical protein LKI57_07215, partial [Acetobacter lovaniensis]|nr:hypothetical protein [Acetobacter lovaniensis]
MVLDKSHAVPDRVASRREQCAGRFEATDAGYVLFFNEAKNRAALSSSSFVFFTYAGKKLAGREAGLNRP